MTDDTDIITLRQPESVEDPLTEIARDGARRMLAAALRAEADAVVASHSEEVLADGRQRVVRHGYGAERSIQTGIGALDVRRPKVRDRAADVPSEKKIRFTSNILPKWARRSKSLDALLPVLYARPAANAFGVGEDRDALRGGCLRSRRSRCCGGSDTTLPRAAFCSISAAATPSRRARWPRRLRWSRRCATRRRPTRPGASA